VAAARARSRGARERDAAIENPTWESLQQTPGQVAQWEKLGYDAAKAHDVIQNKLQLRARLDVDRRDGGRAARLFRVPVPRSAKEYNEVIAEKFPGQALTRACAATMTSRLEERSEIAG
jgi:hypothetical protein